MARRESSGDTAGSAAGKASPNQRINQAALRWAYIAAVLNLAATIPEQLVELILITSHIGVAKDVVEANEGALLTQALAAFVDEQQWVLSISSVWAGFVYLPMTLAWHHSLSLVAGATKAFEGFVGKVVLASIGTLGVSVLFVAGQVWLDWKPSLVLSAAAGIGFVLLCVWSVAVSDLAGRAHHRPQNDSLPANGFPNSSGPNSSAPNTSAPNSSPAISGPVRDGAFQDGAAQDGAVAGDGATSEANAQGLAPGADSRYQAEGLHQLVWPTRSYGTWLEGPLNSRGLRDLMRLLPWINLRSDITDVVYLNWLVPTKKAATILPQPLRCADLDGLTAVSVLTYRHGSLGPTMLGPLRSLLPSPLQSNWRLYLQPVTPGGRQDAIYFFKTVLGSTAHVVGARLAADGLPAHRSLTFSHECAADQISIQIEAGHGSSPALSVLASQHAEHTLPPAWAERFENWKTAATYLIEQNAAVYIDVETGQPNESRIAIPIDLATVNPVSVQDLDISGIPDALMPPPSPDDPSEWCFGFVVPAVRFDALGEGPVTS